ncbi:MAG: glutamate synthase subunit beta [Deltaproteobacteria bacterium]|nr:glutamate synthase subunit beta [Deltaproteobacteria bacterium]
MGKVTGFKEYPREEAPRRPAQERVFFWREFCREMPEGRLRTQGARCMDCGVPFCHGACPLGNLVPDWTDMVWRGRFRDALDQLLKTNNFPEFTGRVCPAPCEEACVLGLSDRPVTIEHIEKTIAERGFAEGWLKPEPPLVRTGKRVAVVGSGPAGLAAAAQLNRAGHLVTVFERAERAGGVLMYGVPEFKLEKRIVDRRLRLLEAEGIEFRTRTSVGTDVAAAEIRRSFDAVLLCCGAARPRDIEAPGRGLGGIHFAMEYLTAQNRANLGETPAPSPIDAAGKRVVILGGGDTGADCLGTALRQGARSVHQFEILPMPPHARTDEMPWPTWPMILRSSPAHEEGGVREWSVRTTEFVGTRGRLTALRATRVEWEGGAFELPCDLCLLAMGFAGAETALPAELGVTLDSRGNIAATNFATNVPGVFAAGDARRGQSLVVRAIAEGRAAARSIDTFLMGASDLPG